MQRTVLAAALIAGCLLATAHALAREVNPLAAHAAAGEPIARIVFRLRTPPATGRALEADAEETPRPVGERLQAVAGRTGVSLHLAFSLTGDIHVARLLLTETGTGLAATLAALRADPAVEYADPDRRRYIHAGGTAVTPDDPLFEPTPGGATGQWYLGAPTATPSGMSLAAVNAVGAWGSVTGSAGIVIADLDTGVRFEHPDLGRADSGGKLLPGYDFIGPDGAAGGTTFVTANDGGGRDADASDPGDWVTSGDLTNSFFTDCSAGNSSWHGTRTAGILGARTNNGLGIAGIAWNSWILPARVLGKCGGYDSNILAAMLWAAGIPVSGVPVNPYPARIINMSLGSVGQCSAGSGGYQDVIGQLAARGAIVVVSAGNEGGPVDSPANCPGAIAVTGVRHIGTKVGYANVGPEVAIAAPAGNCVNTAGACLFSIDTTTNLGATMPGASSYTNQSNFNIGTSFSAPIVAGIAALMLSANSNLTAAQLKRRLSASARAFPVVATDDTGAALPMCAVPPPGGTEAIECNCTTSTCGAGLADAEAAVAEALRPIAALALAATTAPGQSLTLDAGGSAAACNHSIASYAWAILPSSTAPGTPALTSLTGSSTSLDAPTSGTISVSLTVTDETGRTDVARVDVTSALTSTTAPASAGTHACAIEIPPPVATTPTPPATGGGGGGGGGGALDPLLLACLLLARRRVREVADVAAASG